jgi:hypothetical protein
MKTLIAAITVFFLAIVSVPAKSQVLQCTDGMPPIRDGWLQHSVEKLKLEHPDIRFQDDDKPCLHARHTVKALNRTLGRNHLKSIAGYEFVVIVNGEEYFTVERFKSKRPRDLQTLATALKNNRSRILTVESFTGYEYFLAGDSIVIMISSATGHIANSKMFWEVQQTFSSLATTGFRLEAD